MSQVITNIINNSIAIKTPNGNPMAVELAAKACQSVTCISDYVNIIAMLIDEIDNHEHMTRTWIDQLEKTPAMLKEQAA